MTNVKIYKGIKINSAKIGWAIVVIWFSANLLSQALYMGLHGTPYNASAMLSSVGVWYWGLLVLELVVWVLFGMLVVSRVRLRIAVRQRHLENTISSLHIPPMVIPTIDPKP
ncbi:MAG: hypothetical protein QF440_04285 [Candidatus Thalassarchaeaceae archaeon]|jgi:hypothetical protein|nr:hypothetical protein [Candidatus Thalassarchaeaceae archaeon]